SRLLFPLCSMAVDSPLFPFPSRALFFLHEAAATVIYTLSLHDALPICICHLCSSWNSRNSFNGRSLFRRNVKCWKNLLYYDSCQDRKSTRLNSSHVSISYAVFCLKKKNDIEVAENDAVADCRQRRLDD